MKKNYFFLILGFLFIIPFYSLSAQGHDILSKNKKYHIFLGTDLVSRYIWRGAQFGGNAPAMQPFITYNYGSFEVGVWGSYSLAGDNYSQEVDLHISKSFAKDMFTITITDYFFPDEVDNYKYFNYKKNETDHIFEATFAYNGIKNIPLTAFIATNFYGNDAARINDNPESPDFNEKTGIQYSTYLELAYPFKVKNIDVNTFLGVNLTAPRELNTNTGYLGETGFYGDKVGFVNVGFKVTKNIKITHVYSLPLNISLITNPQIGKIYFVAGISF